MLNLPENIETERLLIRKLRLADAEAVYYGYASRSEATLYVSWPTHTSIEVTRQFLAVKQDDWVSGVDYAYAIEEVESGKLIGGIGAVDEQGKVSLGYIINPDYKGRGYATEATRALVHVLTTIPEVWRIWAFCDVDNIASQKVLEKSGFTYEAVLSSWCRFVNQGNAAKDCAFYLFVTS